MMLWVKKYCFIGLLGMVACQSNPQVFPSVPESDRSFLYPSRDQRDVDFLCTSVYQIPQFKAKPFVQSSPPSIIIVTDTMVTFYFSNDYTQTLAKPGTVRLPAGTYPCS